MKISALMPLVTFAMIATACVTPFQFKDEHKGLIHNKIGLSIPYQSPGSKSILSAEWVDQTSDYRFESSDVTYSLVTEKHPEPKERHESVPRFEKFYENKRDAGLIYLHASPLPSRLKDKNLDVILKNQTENLAQKNFFANPKSSESKNLKLVTKIKNVEKFAKTGIDEGLIAEIELADSEQLLLDPSNRLKTIKIALLKPSRGWRVETPIFSPYQSRSSHRKVEVSYVPSLVMVVYENQPDYFAAHGKEFEALIQQMEFPKN